MSTETIITGVRVLPGPDHQPRRGGDGMSVLEPLARLNDRLDAAIDRHVHRHPTVWIIATSLLIVAVILALRGALL